MTEVREKPYRVTLHWDSTREGTWTGFGRDMSPACGQSEFITVTDMAEAVGCRKCRDAMERQSS
jgi:hypothetical protein